MVTRMRTTGFASKQTRRRRGGWEERGEDNKKPRQISQRSVQSSDSAALGRAPTTLRTQPEAPVRSQRLRAIAYGRFQTPGWVSARSRRSSLGATSGTRWRTRPCRGAAHSAPFPSFFLRLPPSCAPCERRKGWSEYSPVCRWPLAVPRLSCPLPWAVGLQRAADSACLFRVLRSAPSPPAQTSLRGREKIQCACAARAPLPVPCCH